MNTKKVKDLMIPVADYATVHKDASLLEAIIKLRESQENTSKKQQPFRAVLVLDDNGNIVGKIGHLAFLKALEPKYGSLVDIDKLTKANLSSDFISQMMDHFNLWNEDFYDVCSRVRNIRVQDIVKPVEEIIDANASLVEAMHKVIMWQTLSILVRDGEKIVGIIRLSDIYNEFESYVIDTCKVKS